MRLSSTIHNCVTEENHWFGNVLGSRAGMFLGCLLYVCTFAVVYRWVIVPVWGYEGFRQRATLSRQVTAGLLASLPGLWMPLKLKRPSQIVYWMLYLLVVAPACLVSMWALEDQSSGPVMLSISLVGVFALTGVVYQIPLLPLPRFHLEQYEFGVLLVLMSTIFYALLISSFGLHFHFVSFADTYSVRAEYQGTLDHAPALVAYAISWQAWVINPFVMAMGLRWRRPSWLLIGVVAQFAIYSISAFRSMFFSAALLLYLLWVMKSEKTFGIRFATTWTTIFAVAGALQYFGWALIPAAFITVRMTALPGLLTGYYYEFFSSHPHAMLGHSIFKPLVGYPYAVQPPYLIASTYFHSSVMESNANLWADGFANFGYVGLVICALLFAIVLWLYDSMALGHDKCFAALAISLPAFALANTGILTALLTNGIGLAMVLIYLMPLMSGLEVPRSGVRSRRLYRRNKLYPFDKRVLSFHKRG
jgi:hypothetical protein